MAFTPTRMFFRLLLRAATVRRGRTLTALLAIAVAATLCTALLNLYVDITAKMANEFRKFGANVVVTSGNGRPLTAQQLSAAKANLPEGTVAVPFGYVVAHTAGGKAIVVAGTDFAGARRLNAWWSVTAWPETPGAALVGARAAAAMDKESSPDEVVFDGRPLKFSRGGQLRTGGEEDSRIYLPLDEFIAWTRMQPTVLEVAIPGSPQEIAAAVARLNSALAGKDATVQPVRQVVEAETRVLDKTRSILLWCSIAIAFTVALCVLATLTASVLERRKDYAVMKALGSSQRAVNAIFLGESLSLGALGAVVGFAAGCGLAAWIGRVNFHAAVMPRFDMFPFIFAGCLLVAFLSALVPLTLLKRIQPAVMLKGE